MTLPAVPDRSGELMGRLDHEPGARLADALAALYERQDREKEWVKALEGELHRRLQYHDREKLAMGRWEVAVKVDRRSSWDADELEDVLRELIDEGKVHAGECTGIIKREATVSGQAANDLAHRLTGRARAMVESCRTWQRKRQNKLLVTPLPEEALTEGDEPNPQEVFPDEHRSLRR